MFIHDKPIGLVAHACSSSLSVVSIVHDKSRHACVCLWTRFMRRISKTMIGCGRSGKLSLNTNRPTQDLWNHHDPSLTERIPQNHHFDEIMYKAYQDPWCYTLSKFGSSCTSLIYYDAELSSLFCFTCLGGRGAHALTYNNQGLCVNDSVSSNFIARTWAWLSSAVFSQQSVKYDTPYDCVITTVKFLVPVFFLEMDSWILSNQGCPNPF